MRTYLSLLLINLNQETVCRNEAISLTFPLYSECKTTSVVIITMKVIISYAKFTIPSTIKTFDA